MVIKKTMLNILDQYQKVVFNLYDQMKLSLEYIEPIMKLMATFELTKRKLESMNELLQNDQVDSIARSFMENSPNNMPLLHNIILSMLTQFEVAKEKYIEQQTGSRTEREKQLEKDNHKKFFSDLHGIWQQQTQSAQQADSSKQEVKEEEEKGEEDAPGSKCIL